MDTSELPSSEAVDAVTLWASHSHEALHPVGRFEMDTEGVVTVVVLDPEFQGEMEGLFVHGVGPWSKRRMVKPSEGTVFLDSLIEQFHRSSVFRPTRGVNL